MITDTVNRLMKGIAAVTAYAAQTACRLFIFLVKSGASLFFIDLPARMYCLLPVYAAAHRGEMYMHIMDAPKKVVASAVISELQSSDMYLTLVARLFDLRANLNGVRVTEAFLDEIVENEAKYICHPLYADIRGLIANKTVGHMYNKKTGQFHSTQIGAFYHFEKEVENFIRKKNLYLF